MRQFLTQDPTLAIGNVEEVLGGNSLMSSVLRMIAYQTIPEMRTTLAADFPSEVRFVGEKAETRIISFVEDVIKFGATSVRKERVFLVGHQGSGKTSLAHSVRLVTSRLMNIFTGCDQFKYSQDWKVLPHWR